MIIALALAAQLSVEAPTLPTVQLFRAPPIRSSELIRTLPNKSVCGGNPGRLEASTAQPAALYRRGDRPAKGLRNWIDYPDGALCLVETGR
jgi:hypothetical protein